LAPDALPWAGVLLGGALSMETDALAAIAGAGGEFFAAAVTAAEAFSDALAPADGAARLAALRKGTGKSGAAFFKPLRAALTGLLHGPELAPLLSVMPAPLIHQRLAAHTGG
jgi:glutamyl-tRNA synthetase